MNRFSDGFSDNSYEELLNQYAGESLGSKKATEDTKTSTPVKKAPQSPAYEEPVFNIDTRRRQKPEIKKDLDLDLIAPFESAPKKAQPVIEKKYEHKKPVRKPTTDTMEFSTKKKISVSSAFPSSATVYAVPLIVTFFPTSTFPLIVSTSVPIV